ncbi:MAG TPA: hypothetical protein VK582_17895 [Pyrinomonadaceae bacterium]|nr:hypothetical protein [Pyrinomonadaceae bacterium]
MDPSELISKLTDRGDLGLALISYVIGYSADFWVFPGGMPSGVVAALSSAGAVGIKNLIQSIFVFWRSDINENLDEILIGERYSRLADYIDQFLKTVEVEKDHPIRLIQRELAEREFLWRSGITSDTEFSRYLRRVVSICRDSSERYLDQKLRRKGSLPATP